MSPFYEVSLPFLIAAALVGALVFLLTAFVRHEFSNALTSIDEKSAGLLIFYRNRIVSLFEGEIGWREILFLLHYVALNLLIPCVGFAFFLRTDGNFLVVIATLLWSANLAQRVFRGPAGA